MLLAGTDEAGLGALAGPLVAVTVVLDSPIESRKELPGWWPVKEIGDSKSMTEAKRESLRGLITQFVLDNDGEVGIESVSVERINEIGYAKAHQEALANSVRRATKDAGLRPDLLVVDGKRMIVGYPWRQMAEPKADANYFVVSLASMFAKILRDDEMRLLDKENPEYGWVHNKGYPTLAHKDALLQYGMTSHHRKKPCATVLEKMKPHRVPAGW